IRRHDGGLVRRLLFAVVADALAGCTTSYSLTLMPRTSGQLYYGEASATTGSDAQVSVTIGARTYQGTWVVATPAPTTGFVIGGVFGSRRSGVGTSVSVDQSAGTEAKGVLGVVDGAGPGGGVKGGK